MSEEIRFEQEIEALLDQEPFVPFTIILTSGSRYEVTGPRRLLIGESVCWVIPDKPPSVFFRKNQLAGVEVHEPT